MKLNMTSRGVVMSKFFARLIESHELPKLLQLYKHLHEEDPELEYNDQLEKLWDEIIRDDYTNILVVEQDGELVATCALNILKNLTRGARPYALIENVVTHKEYRRQGLGRMILNKAIEISKQRNCYKMMLLTGQKGEEVHRFYQSLGFRKDVKTGYNLKLE
jgi:GNAT superfamily N-acetyltransferase